MSKWSEEVVVGQEEALNQKSSEMTCTERVGCFFNPERGLISVWSMLLSAHILYARWERGCLCEHGGREAR